MIWCSGWKLAAAVSNAGGLGLIGAGSMSPEILDEHLLKASENTTKPFGVNIPLMGPDIEKKINLVFKHHIRLVFTSAGHPQKWTSLLKRNGCIVAHVVSSTIYAIKAVEAGVDAIVVEGFEAGGHNGREETTSFVLIPAVCKATDIPVIAAGGMFGGESLMAALALGADAIQIGSRFAACNESSAHDNFKNKIFEINEGDTRLILKKLIPVRMIRNTFFNRIIEAEESGASRSELIRMLGEGRSRKGIFEGDLEEGELEIGQVSSLINKKQSAAEIIEDIISTYKQAKDRIIESE